MSGSSSAVSTNPEGVDSLDVSRALEERYDRILREHGPALRRVAAIYEADPARREDLFQDVCLALWQALPRFRGDCSERTFAFRIAHNRGLSHGWKARGTMIPGTAALEEAEEIADHRHDPESELYERDRRERLREAVRRLPPVARQVVALSLEGLSHREIGEVLGLTENNVAVRLTRARKLLRQILETGK
ncbi:MAG TPA: sigma-70 family RNA polymerase sigma factor [Thermoanaerobaculia bacterium]|nr:sigma-70 family RNA polymerase sigma factor [Thermoanaerobaculia bacterium]